MNHGRGKSPLPEAAARATQGMLGCARGNVTLIAAVGLLAVSSLTGAAVTVARMNSVALELRDRVDGLALSAAMAVRDGEGADAVGVRADQAFSELKGGLAGSGGAEVEIVSTAGAEVVATMSREVPVLLGELLGRGTLRVSRSARAVASAGEPVCLHILSRDEPDALSRRGSSALEARNCVAQVNSSSAEALDSRGAAGQIETLLTRVAGTGRRVGGFSPAPEFGVPVVADPYAQHLVWPDDSPCSSAGLRIRRSSHTLAPGVICGDLDLGAGADVTLSPGLHVLTGDLRMSAGARLSAVGVTLILVGDTSRLDIGSGSDARFSAPEDGPWKQIAVAVKPQSAEIASSIQGGSGVDLVGVLYLPSQKLHLTGGGRMAAPTDHLRMIVANRLDLNGNGRVWLNGAGSPTRAGGGVRLIE